LLGVICGGTKQVTSQKTGSRFGNVSDTSKVSDTFQENAVVSVRCTYKYWGALHLQISWVRCTYKYWGALHLLLLIHHSI